MPHPRTPFVIAAIAALLTACGGGSGSDAPSPPVDRPYARLIDELQREIPAAMAEHQVVGLSLALVDDQQVVWQAGFGVREAGKTDPVSADTLMRAGSITKLVTATAVMRLAEHGQFTPDAPLADALPGFHVRSRFHADPAQADREVTLRQMLSHHAGLPETSLAGIGHAPGVVPGNLAQAVQGVHLTYPPGQLLAYSNLAYDLLGSVIEQRSGLAYEQYVTTQVLRPLGMTRSTVRTDPTQALAHGHIDGASVGTQAEDYDLMPAGGLWSSAGELARFMQMVFNDGTLDGQTILRPQTLAQMLTPQHPDNPFDRDSQVGLGWFVTRPEVSGIAPGVAVAQHDGSTGADHSILMLLPQHRLGVVILTNSDTGDAITAPYAEAILRRMWSEKTAQTPPPDPLLPTSDALAPTPADLTGYPGIYRYTMGESGVLELTSDGARLLLSTPGAAPQPLLRDADGWYRVAVDGGLDRETRLRVDTIGSERALLVERAGRGQATIATRISPTPIPPQWLARQGSYDASDTFHLSLVAEDGWLALVLDDEEVYPLQALDANTAVVAGIGRGNGHVIEAAPDGSLRILDLDIPRAAN
ncbi:MAG: beta-lactamase family protein [Rhodocyclales bacterium]|nr:beta-lactamase family protein [Rhodocyclales bacterium]